MMPETPTHLVIGRIVRPHGVRGEMKVEILTDFPERLGRQTRRVFVGPDPERLHPYRVRSARQTGNFWLLALAGVNTPEQAELLRDQYLYVLRSQAAPLEAGEYYHHQIVGLEVYAQSGEDLGPVTEVLETGANDVYIVRGANQELLLPAIPDVVLEVDVEQGRMTVRLPEGLR